MNVNTSDGIRRENTKEKGVMNIEDTTNGWNHENGGYIETGIYKDKGTSFRKD